MNKNEVYECFSHAGDLEKGADRENGDAEDFNTQTFGKVLP